MTHDTLAAQLDLQGWASLPPEPGLTSWVEAAKPAALATLSAPEYAHWWRAGATWFVGVNVLGNDATGAVAGGPQLQGQMAEFLTASVPNLQWDRAQISVCLPGFPIQEGESDAAFDFRVKRDGAHLDGLLPEGPERRRHLQEFHRFILGIPLTRANSAASPLVVWEGSHKLMCAMLNAELGHLPYDQWPDVDMTDAYTKARRAVFDQCARLTVTVPPGGCYILHRHLVHGVQPWGATGQAEAPGRVIAYFRPEAPNRRNWLSCAPLV